MKKRKIVFMAAVISLGIFTACRTSSQQITAETEKEEFQEISQEDAKRIAFEDAKITSEKEVSGFSIHTDQEEKKKVYEVEFTLLENNWEYEYKILAEDGKILSKDVEETFLDVQTKISMEEAKKAALDRVKGAGEENIRIELDKEDEIFFYKGEILYNNKEYEFKIDAQTGMMIEWSEEV